jgi:hypothetical protein
MDPRQHRQLIVDTLTASGLDVDEVGEDRWMTMLAGEWKRTIPVLLALEDRSLKLTSLLCGVPDEGHEEVYALLLHRNERLTWIHFALDDEGDVVMVGTIPRDVLDAAVLDEVLGQVLLTADETFNSVLRAGFASYIEAEQRWRAKNGMPPNPVSTQG